MERDVVFSDFDAVKILVEDKGSLHPYRLVVGCVVVLWPLDLR